MPEINVERVRRCRSMLQELSSAVQARARHWRKLTSAAAQAAAYASRLEDPLAEEVAAAMARFAGYPAPLSYVELRNFAQEGKELIARARARPDRRVRGSLWLALHGSIEQHLAMAETCIQGLENSLSDVMSELRLLSGGGVHACAIAEALHECKPEISSVESLERLVGCLDAAQAGLPRLPRQPVEAPRLATRTHLFRIAIIEDEEEWWLEAQAAVHALRDELGEAFTIEAVWFDNAEAARDALMLQTITIPHSRKVEDEEELWQTIAVVDMGLPKNAAHLREIKEGESTPERAVGHALLLDLRSYRVNIPCIVLTMAPQLQEDQVQACAQGIEPTDYILKGVDKRSRLVNALRRVIERSQAARIELRDDPQYRVLINRVPVPMEEMPYRTFYALCRLSQSTTTYFTPEQIRDQLDRSFHSQYQYLSDAETSIEKAELLATERGDGCWKASWLISAANVIHLWAACKRDSGDELEKAIIRLGTQFEHQCNEGWTLLRYYRRVHLQEGPWSILGRLPKNRKELADCFEYVFGGLELETDSDYDLDNIARHIHEIRGAIHAAFQAVHQFIEPREIVMRGLVEGWAGDDVVYGYRVQGEIPAEVDLDPLSEKELNESLEDEEYDNPLEEYKGTECDVFPEGRTTLKSAELLPRGSSTLLKALVVENEEIYRERLQELLIRSGFQVETATNQRDAVSKALLYRPQLLCLDMHIPTTPSEYEANPASGDERGGLSVLRRVRKELKDTKIVIPTTLADRDELRELVAVLQVPVANFIPKGETLAGAHWESFFLLTVDRLREEIRTRAILPPVSASHRPIVQILEGSDLNEGRLYLKVNGHNCSPMRGNQGRLVATLLNHHNEVVSHGDLDQVVYGEPVAGSKRTQLLKVVRQKIREEWLGLPEPERPELEIIQKKDKENGIVFQPPFSIEIESSSNLPKGPLDLLVDGRKRKVLAGAQARLLALLIPRQGSLVSYKEIGQILDDAPEKRTEHGKTTVNLNGSNKQTKQHKQRIKALQDTIRMDWLELPEPERPELEILESVSGGMMLHVHVDNPIVLPNSAD